MLSRYMCRMVALRADCEVLERKQRSRDAESLLPELPEATLDFYTLPTRSHRLLPVHTNEHRLPLQTWNFQVMRSIAKIHS
jgi:hypothetical protein